jgi:ABC-type multidrug transport system permease subunit
MRKRERQRECERKRETERKQRERERERNTFLWSVLRQTYMIYLTTTYLGYIVYIFYLSIYLSSIYLSMGRERKTGIDRDRQR